MATVQKKFSEFPYERPNLEKLEASYKDLTARFTSATTAKEQNNVIRDWNTLRTAYMTNISLAHVRFTLNVKDEWALSERLFIDENSPTIAEWSQNFVKTILASPFLKEIEEEWGTLFIENLEQGIKTFSQEIKPMLIKQSELSKKYDGILASAEIELDGEIFNLSRLERKLLDTNRETRKNAQKARFKFLESNKEDFDKIYDDMVKLRHKIAKQLGFNNYVEFRYVEMGRNEYTPDDVAKFRDYVHEKIVPLIAKQRKKQADRLDVDEIRFHDEILHFPNGNPTAQGNPEWIVEQARQMYSELSPQTDEFFTMMIDKELMDLVTRPNKAVGGYCTNFPTFGVPFIFSNFNGTTHDVEVLTHEAGHAFQAYKSRNNKVVDYIFPTMEACEIHSMGMEYLTWNWMDKFFGTETSKFKFYHLLRSLMFLPYCCAVDEFQHWVYENPEVTPADRKSKWHELELKYLPWRKYEDLPYAEEGTVWQFQKHIYDMPFYYIDYALAQICALQIWSKSRKNMTEALEDYIRICEIGGSKTFLEIVKAGNMHSPFETECLDSVIHEAEEWLEAWKN
ncbi:MAG: M3 family oligoendopeptidase [Bacteroidetes bacterium]|nr:M3 family oligoendopeptidase [Bacteroidota bacterium]